MDPPSHQPHLAANAWLTGRLLHVFARQEPLEWTQPSLQISHSAHQASVAILIANHIVTPPTCVPRELKYMRYLLERLRLTLDTYLYSFDREK